MSKYRITVTTVQRIILEGEGSLSYADARADDILMGYVTEAEDEVSSYHSDKPIAKLEVCLNEEEDLWAVVNK